MNTNPYFLICIVFIIYLFKVEQKANNLQKGVLWLPLIWILFSLRPPVGWLNLFLPSFAYSQSASSNYIEGNPINRNIFLLLTVVALIINLRRGINWGVFFKNNIPIMLFLGYNLLSVMWSEYPFVAFKRWYKSIGDILMMLIILSEPAPFIAIASVLRKIAYIVFPLSFVAIKYLPGVGRYYSIHSGNQFFCGISGSGKNGLGSLCMIFGLCIAWNIVVILKSKNAFNNYKIYLFNNIVILGLAVWLLLIADSKTSLLCLVIGFLIILILELRTFKMNLKAIYIYGAVFMALYAFLQITFDLNTHIFALLGRDPTLTGRTEIWARVLSMQNHPLVGAGFESFWLSDRVIAASEGYQNELNQAHNGYIEIYLNLGIIGVILLVMLLISGFKNSYNRLQSDFDFGKICVAFVFIMCIYNITEALFKCSTENWLVLLLLGVLNPPANLSIIKQDDAALQEQRTNFT